MNRKETKYLIELENSTEWDKTLDFLLESYPKKVGTSYTDRTGALYENLSQWNNPNFRENGHIILLLNKGHTPEKIGKLLNKSSNWISSFKKTFAKEPFFGTLNSATQDIKSLENKIKQNKTKTLTVTMGTTPSGPITLANAYTIATGANTISKLANNIPINFNLGINDLNVDISPEELNKRISYIKQFLEDLNKVSGIEISTNLYSETQSEPEFRKMLKNCIKERITTPDKIPLLKIQKYFTGLLNSDLIELNEHSSDTEINNIIDNPDIRIYSTILGLVSLRARYAQSDIHVLGGDQTHIGKMFNPDRFPKGHKVIPFTPGIIYGLDGEEMHASNGNALNYHELRNGINTMEKILSLSDNSQTHLIGPVEYANILKEGFDSYKFEDQMNLFDSNFIKIDLSDSEYSSGCRHYETNNGEDIINQLGQLVKSFFN